MTQLIIPVSGQILSHSESLELLKKTFQPNSLQDGLVQKLRNNGFGSIISKLDPYLISGKNDYQAVLKARYHNQMVADGLSTGKFQIVKNGEFKYSIIKNTQENFESIAGLIFEAYTVRKVNQKSSQDGAIGRSLFRWATERPKAQNKFIEPFKAIGVGHEGTPRHLQNGQDQNFDLIFVRENKRHGMLEPATLPNSTIRTGIQIKAIRGGEKEKIILPLIARQYFKVLTYLKHENGKHSAEACFEELDKLRKSGSISEEIYFKVKEGIGYPEKFGIDQKEVDQYYEYIKMWYRGQAKEDQVILDGVNLGVAVQENKKASLIIIGE